MKWQFLTILLMTIQFTGMATSYTSVSNGTWTNTSTWSPAGCPGTSDQVVINHTVTLNTSIGQPGLGSMIINSSGALISDGNNRSIIMKTGGTTIIYGVINIEQLDVKNLANNGTFTIATGATATFSSIVTGGGSGSLIVNGNLTAGNVNAITITGTGTVTGTSYSGVSSIFGITTLVNGTTYYGIRWTGNSSKEWNNTSNWLNGVIPNSYQSANIPGGCSNYPEISDDVSINVLEISSGASVTVLPGYTLTVIQNMINKNGYSGIILKSNSSGTGNLITDSQVSGTAERWLGGNSSIKPYHFISSPVNNASFSTIWQNGDYNVYYYNETDTSSDLDIGWQRISGGNLENGRGYAVVSHYSSRTLSFQGTLNNAAISKSVTYTNSSGPFSKGDPRGWNLVGNPFPCALSSSAFISSNSQIIDSYYHAVYFWNDLDGNLDRASDYAVRNSVTGTQGAKDGIQPGQGFFIKASTSGNLQFLPSQKTSIDHSPFFINENIYDLSVFVEGPENLQNEIKFVIIPDATTGHDKMYDALKLRGNPFIALYSFVEDNPEQYIIQGLPPVEDEIIIRIGLMAGKNGEYFFSIGNTAHFSAYLDVFLEDRITGKMIDLKMENGYKVVLKAGEYNDRFFLHFVNSSRNALDVVEAPHIQLTSHDKQVILSNYTSGKYKIGMYSTDGKLLFQSEIMPFFTEVIPSVNTKGIVILILQNESYRVIRKVFLN